MAGVEGLEPSPTSVLGTGVLPITPNPYKMATCTGLEPVTSGVTGRRSTLLS